MAELQFICLKWGTKYPPIYVNRIYNMIDRYTKKAFKLYCITDDEKDLLPNIIPLPIEENNLKGWWHKLSIFKEDLYGLEGDLIFLDLDVVITEDLSPLFDYEPGEFVIIRDLADNGYNSSVFRLRVGSKAYVWDRFLESSEEVVAAMHGDQDWITRQVNDAKIWPAEWVVSFKKQCNSRIRPSLGKLGIYLRKSGLFLPKDNAVLPDGAKIVQFHGKPDPEDVIHGTYGAYKAAPWIKDYWV